MKKLTLLVAALGLAASAQAATVSYDFTKPLQTTEINQTGALGLFDSSLGTLTGATITVGGQAVFSFTGNNTASQSQRATLTSSTELFWDSSITALDAFLQDSVLLSATSGSQSYAVGETKSFGPFNISGGNNDDLASILAALQAPGGGSFNVSCESSSGLAVQGGGGNIGTTQSTQAGCNAAITYTYDAAPSNVPEPASLALVGLALAGVGAARRRRAR